MSGRPSSRSSYHPRPTTMLRSHASARQSMLPSSGAGPSMTPQYDTDGQLLLSPSQQKALNKQKEWEGFIKVLRQTTQLNEHFEQLASKTELMEDGGHTMAKVLENWQNVFRATHIALASMANRQASGEEDIDAPTLVRIPTSGRTPSQDTPSESQTG